MGQVLLGCVKIHLLNPSRPLEQSQLHSHLQNCLKRSSLFQQKIDRKPNSVLCYF